MLISIHIPKCAGTSFRHVLRHVYGDGLWLNYGTIFSRAQAQEHLIPPGSKCIHGHFLADALDDFASDAQRITWLRHPVERVVSNYFHFLRSPDVRDDCCRAIYERGLSLRQFAELDWMRNGATRYLAGKSLGEFAFVGVAERFEESLDVFAKTFGWPQPLPAPVENTNPQRTSLNYELSAEDSNFILALNTADLALYRSAVANLDAALKRPPNRAA